jgi:acyl-CoA dehydrogenase
MIERTLFSPDHESFRDSFRKFIDKLDSAKFS